MLKNLFNKSDVASKQEALIQSLEGIGDILVYETKRQKNKLVLEGLKLVSDSVKKLFQIQQKDPEGFEKLVVSQEFLELYKKDEKEAQLRLAFDPDKYLVSFSTAINQITRVYEAAVDSRNDEISRFAVYHINWVLDALVRVPDNDIFVQQLLAKLAEITRVAASKNDASAYSAAVHWYTHIVFDRAGTGERPFLLKYLPLFDRYFTSTMRFIVSNDHYQLFQTLVSSLVDGVHVPRYHRHDIWNYGHLILRNDLDKYRLLDEKYGVEKKIKELVNSESDIDTQDKLKAWIERFVELRNVIDPNLTEEQKKLADEHARNVIEYVTSQFKYNNLLEIVFGIGAYCLFKKRPAYICYFWEYKQPPDSDASWIGHDITPSTFDEVVRFYFRKGLFERRADFWEGHHGSESYYKQYFLLLLARSLEGVRPDAEGKFAQIEGYKLPDLHVYRLSDLNYSTDEFIRISEALRQESQLLKELGLNPEKIGETFDGKLIPFLRKLKDEANRQIVSKLKSENISPKKVTEFKNEFIKAFHEGASIRDIFEKYLGEYENHVAETTTGRGERFGINQVDDKAAFFEEWHVHFSRWGENYGRDLASAEDSLLLDEISKECKDSRGLDTALQRFEDVRSAIVFATRGAMWDFFENSKDFRPKWHRDSKQLDVKGFEGWYEFGGQLIPVFETYHRTIEKQVLVLNKLKIGHLVQSNPLNQGEDPRFLIDMFYMSIQAFSENPALLEDLISRSPDWLSKVGDGDSQREHLRERVLLYIFERFEFKKHEAFEGYKILLNGQ